MKLGRCALALLAFSSVASLVTVPVRAQDETGPAPETAPSDTTAVTSPPDAQRRVPGGPMISVDVGSPKASKGTSTKQMPSTGSAQQVQQQAASKVGSESEVCAAPFAESTPQDSSMQSQGADGPGSALGTVLDVHGDAVPGAQITLTGVSPLEQYTTASGENGEFTFANIPPGTYLITVSANGFEPYASKKFTISSAQVYEVRRIQLSIAMQRQTVVVRPTEVVAQMQIRAEEKQRILGVLPNFYTSYIWDAAPLNTKQKFSLPTHDVFDPVSLIGVATTAGIEQATNRFAGYGQRAAGYGKRFAAGLGDEVISGYLSHAVFPSVFHQDPRYFYLGSGSVKSRLIHALSYAVIARSDSGRPMPNYSALLGHLASGAVSNLYYPQADRGVGLAFTDFAIGIGERAGEAVLREFLSKRFTTHVPSNGKP